MYFELLITVMGVALLLEVWRSHRYLRKAMKKSAPLESLERYPSVTVIRPIKGLDVGAEDNIRAALDTGYPGEVETIFVFDDDDEPALPLAQQVTREHNRSDHLGRSRVVVCGPPPPNRTGKLNAMIKGLQEASGELIAFADSDIRPDHTALAALVETLLKHPKAGSAFAPVVSSWQPATVGDAGYALLLNGMYGAAAAATSNRHGGELPFIMGQYMVFKREALEAIGGLECAEGQLVDDMFLGAQVTAAGYSNMVSSQRVPIVQQGLSLRAFWGIFRRWMAFGRSGLPGIDFKLTSILHGVVFWVGLLAAQVALWQGLAHVAMVAFLAPLAVATSINVLHKAVGGAPLRPRHWPVSFGLLLVAPLAYFSLFVFRTISWRGRIYRLNVSSRLSDPAAPGGSAEPEHRPQHSG